MAGHISFSGMGIGILVFFLDRLCVAHLRRRVALWVEELPSDAEMR